MKQTRTPQSSHKTQWTAIALFNIALIALLTLGGFLALRATSAPGTPVPIIEGVQEVRMAVNGLDYEPSVLTVTAGQKVRWVVDGTGASGCARSLISPDIGVRQVLKSGENIIEFTPTQRGTIQFSCSMGMTSGEFRVV